MHLHTHPRASSCTFSLCRWDNRPSPSACTAVCAAGEGSLAGAGGVWAGAAEAEEEGGDDWGGWGRWTAMANAAIFLLSFLYSTEVVRRPFVPSAVPLL